MAVYVIILEKVPLLGVSNTSGEIEEEKALPAR